MTVTTIKVDSAVRDRLARLAAEQGRSIGAVVADLAETMPTQEEKQARRAAAREYMAEEFGLHLSEEDLAKARDLWRQVEERAATPWRD